MPTWLRHTLIALAVLVALVAVAVGVFVASFDANRYKGVLIDWMRDHQQRVLAIDGPIGLTVFPRLGVQLAGVRLSEHQRPKDEFLAIEQATLAVQLLPLLRKELAIDRVAARGVRVAYSRDAQGKSNIDDLLGGPAQPSPADTPPADGGGALRFDVRAIDLQDLQARVHDVPAGIDGSFAVQRLATGRLADGVESPLSFEGTARLAKPALDARVELETRLTLALPAGKPPGATLAGLKLALRGEGFDVRGLDARVEADRLAWQGGEAAAAGTLQLDKLALTVSGERLGVALKDSKLALASLRFEPAQRALQLEGLQAQLAGRSGARNLAATLAWPKLAVTGEQLAGSALQGKASLTGGGKDAEDLQLTLSSQAPSGSFEKIRVPGVRVAVQGSGTGRSVQGEAATDLTLVPQPFAAALDALKLQLAFTDPALPPMTLAVEGSARAGAQDAGWKLAGRINDQQFDTAGQADLSQPVPRVQAQARFAALDLSRFVAPQPAGKTAPDPKAGEAPIDLSGLKAVDATLSLRAGTLVYPPYRVADAVLEATLAKGLLRVNQLSGRAWGGSFNAQATAQAAAQPAAQQLTVKLDAKGVEIGPLLADVAQFKKLEGKGDVRADLTTRGATVTAFKQQLGGTAALQLKDGAVRGINLAKVLRQWKSAVTLDKDAVQAASAEEKTDFSEISASFQVADGVARNKDLDAKSPFLRVGGEGLIDLGRGRIDYLAKATVTGTSKGQGGAELEALNGITVPVQLVGPFEAIDYKVQWSAVSAALLKSQAGKVLGERARGALGGLLGGGAAEPAASGASQPAPKPKEQARERAKDELKKLFGR